MRLADVGDLPATLTTAEAAELLGVSVDHLWELARSGEAPVAPLRLGRIYRWPTPRLLALLGLSATGGGDLAGEHDAPSLRDPPRGGGVDVP